MYTPKKHHKKQTLQKINSETKQELLNYHQGIDSIAQTAQTIPYEVLCALSQRYARHYINAR
ncbi:MAG: hypothetical protein K8953_10940 [Proteobacteria bacterium]|nr:hypothetical protein [Pseudomonadota bacterium]